MGEVTMGMDAILLKMSEQNQIAQVMKENEYTRRFGLTLSQEEAAELVSRRREDLREQQRIEFGEGILTKLTRMFCDSAYIEPEDYAQTLGRLQEIFYLYKNESMDELTDDELLEYMREKFDEVEGSLDYLEDTVLDEFARKIRRTTRKYIGRYREDHRRA